MTKFLRKKDRLVPILIWNILQNTSWHWFCLKNSNRITRKYGTGDFMDEACRILGITQVISQLHSYRYLVATDMSWRTEDIIRAYTLRWFEMAC
ncbi:MAG: hypothetical protein V8K32_11325 [Candidatus Electrothrix gigas]